MQIIFDLVIWSADLMQLCFRNSQTSDIIIWMGAFTTYQYCHTFSYSGNGSQILFHVTSPSMYSNHSKIQKWHVAKISLCRDILPLEVSYLYWYESTLYMSYLCGLLTWFISNFYFWIVFSHVFWFEIHHNVGIRYVIYISGDISHSQIITSIHGNRYMSKVQISTILEGLECPILGRKGFAKLTQKAGRVSSIFLLPCDVFWCPSYIRDLRYHHIFQGTSQTDKL